MARETKTVQSHPDKENKTISRYEMFGWEVVSNQRCQEEEKRGDTWYTVTFNKITFSREKGEPWYKRVCELEAEYDDICSYEYEDIKDDYGYDEISGIGKRPKQPYLPKLAEPKKFFKGLFTFIIGAIISLIGMLISMSGNDGSGAQLLGTGGYIVALVGFVMTLCRIKYLKGLKGQAKQDAINEYNKLVKENDKYDEDVSAFLGERLYQIEEEVDKLING